MKYETLIVGILETNCYLVYCPETHDCAIVDPGAEEEKIFQIITRKNLKPTVILNTHGHIDHIGANRAVKEKFSIPLCIHAEDSQMLGHVQQSELAIYLGTTDSPSPDRLIKEGDEIEVLFNLSSREHNGRYYTQADAWSIKGDALSNEPVVVDIPAATEEDDLPF